MVVCSTSDRGFHSLHRILDSALHLSQMDARHDEILTPSAPTSGIKLNGTRDLPFPFLCHAFRLAYHNFQCLRRGGIRFPLIRGGAGGCLHGVGIGLSFPSAQGGRGATPRRGAERRRATPRDAVRRRAGRCISRVC